MHSKLILIVNRTTAKCKRPTNQNRLFSMFLFFLEIQPADIYLLFSFPSKSNPLKYIFNFQFDSQDVLIPWHRPTAATSTPPSANPSSQQQGQLSRLLQEVGNAPHLPLGGGGGGAISTGTYTTSEDDVTHYHVYTQTASDSSATNAGGSGHQSRIGGSR